MGAESLFLARQLETIRATVLAVKYPRLLGRQVLPTKYEGDAGTSAIVQWIEDVTGQAKIISDKGRDLPKVNVKRGEYSYPVRDLGIAFDYSRRELAAAIKAGMDLSAKKATQARNAMERTLDGIIAFGDADSGLPGFLNNSQITPSNVPADGTGSSTTFANKTADKVIRDMYNACNALSNNSSGTFQATDLLMPLTQYNYIASTPMGTSAFTDKTILQFFKESFPTPINVTPWYRLTGAGASGTDRMVAYQRDPEVLGLSIQAEFDMLPPQEVGLMVEVPCTLVTAGVLIDHPLGVAYRDGI